MGPRNLESSSFSPGALVRSGFMSSPEVCVQDDLSRYNAWDRLTHEGRFALRRQVTPPALIFEAQARAPSLRRQNGRTLGMRPAIHRAGWKHRAHLGSRD